MTNKHKRGFTLIETLLAVLILATAIAGPLSIAAKGLQVALISKDQIVAAFLAQDAIEYVHFIRDGNSLARQSDWLAGLDGANNGHTNVSSGVQANCTGGNVCIIDSLKDQASVCGTSVSACSGNALYFDSSSGAYTYTTAGTTKTIFTRTLQITTPSAGGNANEADIVVTVSWNDIGGVTRSVILRDSLLKWQ